jgi:heme exporter protein C
MYWKIFLFLLMSFVIVAGLCFPIVPVPAHWYQFPYIPGLEEKARIIFFHVPTAWLTVIAFFFSTYFSFKYLRNKNWQDDIKAYASAQIGMIFCILATITGSVWAKFNWGSFWNWDPRETSIFALLLIYGALFALRSALDNEEKRAQLSAVYNLISFITVPFFIFIMPRIMSGLHPGSAGDEGGSGPIVNFKMNGNMRIVFFASLTAFSILYYWIYRISSRSLILIEKNNRKLIEE